MLQLRQVQSRELLLRGMLLQATDNGRPEDLSVLQRKEITMKQTKNCCGNCYFYEHGNSDTGFGKCHNQKGGMSCRPNSICYRHITKEQAERYAYVLNEHNKWRRDEHVPNSLPMQDPKELGLAIEFATDVIRTFKRL